MPALSFATVAPFLSLYLVGARARYAQSVNGQQYTLGLSIISAPSANSQFNAPGNLPIAIDVSGNGKLSSQSGSAATSSRFSSLEIYLVSATVNVNVTVSGPDAGLLSQESGSTVKHVDYLFPECLPAGAYNLTLYDSGVFENQAYFTITSVPLTLHSNVAAGSTVSCVTSTRPATQPQADAPLSAVPFLGDGSSGITPGVQTPTDSSSTQPTSSTSSSTSSQSQWPGSTSSFGQPSQGADDDDDDGPELPVDSGGTGDTNTSDSGQNPQVPLPKPECVYPHPHIRPSVSVLMRNTHTTQSDCHCVRRVYRARARRHGVLPHRPGADFSC
ncbi:hypothetical protein BKA62DRAFT_663783 [Auriculariales sp. MPI-PUGE-AT-0066]|nr:hypothetical protein BKA62DRAFT_663783 [Auriculariales sp. MPI-PUGE-AT-0066]